MEKMPESEFASVVEETRVLLKENSEWRARYAGYAEKISGNLGFISSVRSSFREWSPLKIYLNVTSAKTAKNSVRFEFRYMGQTVARLTGKNNKLHKLSTKNYETTNRRDFGCKICLSDADWCGEDASKFRGFFKNKKGNRNIGDHKKNEEHRLESLLLTEFSRIKNKTIRHIKPVTIGRVRFPMPTPISASNHKAIKYSGTHGGGIDILARTGTGGKATRLCIMELKDENIPSEPPNDAMKQAVAYATFIRELLRSDAGELWWKLFGFGGKIPEPLELYAACVMPSGIYNDYSFGNMELAIERDTIKLHYLYFNEEKNRITIKPSDTTLAVIEQGRAFMQITIYRGSKEIGGTLIEVKTNTTRILIDAGYPLFLNNEPIADAIARLPHTELLALGVLPKIDKLYDWDKPGFDAVLISHAHIDHYGLLKYINSAIPVYMSSGTRRLIEISQRFKICDNFDLDIRKFTMYRSFQIGGIRIKPYLMDHSAFDAAAFEINAEGKTVIYSGDFRGHGRKAVCLDRFIEKVEKWPDILLVEGSVLGRLDEQMMTEQELEDVVVERVSGLNSPLLFQCSSQNIDRLVSFYRAALRLKRKFIVDIYTANVLYELRKLGNKLPYPSPEYPGIKVFFPRRLTQKIFNEIGEEYARRFSAFHISREQLKNAQDSIIMACRPSMRADIEKCELRDGVFFYSLWSGYRDNQYQQRFERSLENAGFSLEILHTSGHASVVDIRRVIEGLDPKKLIPIHTMHPDAFHDFSDKTELKDDGVTFEV